MSRRILALVLIFCLFICGCGKKEVKSSVPVIRVAFWGTPEEVEIIQGIIEPWQKEHPEIKVELEHTPFSGYVSKILTRIAGGSAPDVICTEANAPYACVYYNKKLFDTKGVSYPTDDWTWSDLLEKAKALTQFDEQGRVVQYGFYTWAWQNFIYSNGGSLVDSVTKPTRCLMDSPRALEGLEFYVDLIHKYKVSPTPSALINLGMGVQMMFMTGRLAMLGSGVWETPILRKQENFDWDVVMFPKGPGGVHSFGTGGSAYTILKTTKYPKEAWEVLKALTSEPAQIILADSGLAQPANRDIAEGAHFALDNMLPRNKKMLNEAVKYVIYDPFHPRWREINELFIVPELDIIFNGQEPVKEGIFKIVPDINRILSEK
ncbi:MAG: sugar ABC transporter substrate-binding protein [Candidatus Omnitrophica bacterium]|nr:sugar ABC transporter substrate-binding protein [Candidatus Omnitrophota bacterium]